MPMLLGERIEVSPDVKFLVESEILGEFRRQSDIEGAPGKDPIFSAFAEAVCEEIEANTAFGLVVNEVALFYQHHDPKNAGTSEKVGRIRAAVCTDLQQQGIFPSEAFANPYYWRDQLRAIGYIMTHSDVDEARNERLSLNMLTRSVQTNIRNRYLPFELMTQTVAERFPDGASWLDIGCAIQQGTKGVHLKQSYPFAEHMVAPRPRRPYKREPGVLTAITNELVARPSVIREVVGMDLIDGNDPETIAWSRGSLRPQSELMNPAFIDEFDALAQVELSSDDSFRFIRADASTLEGAREFDDQCPGKQFDFISIIACGHQMSRTEFEQTMTFARSRCSPRGVIFLEDFAYQRRGSLRFYKEWHVPYRFRSYIDDGGGIQEFARNADSRCQELQLGIGRIAVGKQVLGMEDAIVRASEQVLSQLPEHTAS
jgi:hypothetical protein